MELENDPELEEARAELIRNDQQRTPVELPGGVHAASAAAMQNQHVADEVNTAARRKYLDIPDADAQGELTPFERYVVVDMLTQVGRCSLLPARAPRLASSSSHPSARCCSRRLWREPTTSSRSKLQMQSSFSCGYFSRYSATLRSWWRCAKERRQQARCSTSRRPSESGPAVYTWRTYACRLVLGPLFCVFRSHWVVRARKTLRVSLHSPDSALSGVRARAPGAGCRAGGRARQGVRINKLPSGPAC